MKTVRLFLLCLLCVSVYAAQEESSQSSPPGLLILKLKWERRIEGPLSWDRPLQDAGGAESHPSPPRNVGGLPVGAGPSQPGGGRLPYVYQYTAEIRNDDVKKIKGLVWEYVLSEPGSGKELGRHKFYSFEKIAPGKRKTLHGQTRSSPTSTVSVAALRKDARAPYDERVEFRCVMYEDGTLWRRSSVPESECLKMKDREQTRSWERGR